METAAQNCSKTAQARKQVEKMNFESFKGMPTVFKHPTRKMFLTPHVDDALVVSRAEDWTRFSEVVRKQLTMNAKGPFEYGSNNNLLPEEEGGLVEARNLCAAEPSYIKKTST